MTNPTSSAPAPYANPAYDLVVIGSGPGGYVAAIRAAQLGMKVACVEKEPKLGGTCLRIGCIPSKTLLDASEKFVTARDHFKDVGIQVNDIKVDLPTMMKRKTKVVDQLTGGVDFLFKKNKVDRVNGTGRFLNAGQIQVTSADGDTKTLDAKKVLIATGSVPVSLPFLPYDGKRVVTSEEALAFTSVPKKLVVIGAGAIGLELGSVWKRLGADVTVLEFMPAVIPGADMEMANLLERSLSKQGLKFVFNAKVTGTKEQDGKFGVTYDVKDGGTQFEPADVVLVAVGRKAFAEGLGAKEIGVTFDSRGRVEVDEQFQTKVPNVYAIGDVIAGAMLAHKAEEEGVAAVEIMAGKAGHVNYSTIPAVVYTSPELAWAGITEEQAGEQKTEVKIGKVRFAANSRALCIDETEGLVKIIADAKTDRVLGVHILHAQASSMIAELVMAMEFGASSEDIARTCHAHPTLPEAIKEAALAVEKRTINV